MMPDLDIEKIARETVDKLGFGENYAVILQALEQVRAASDGKYKRSWNWIGRHYGKLEEWARTELPEPYVTQFFNCIANGTSKHTRDDYFKLGAHEALILAQAERAEKAEAELEQLRASQGKPSREALHKAFEENAQMFDSGDGAGEQLYLSWADLKLVMYDLGLLSKPAPPTTEGD